MENIEKLKKICLNRKFREKFLKIVRQTNAENEHFAKILQRNTLEILSNNSGKIDGVFATCMICGVIETCGKNKKIVAYGVIFLIYLFAFVAFNAMVEPALIHIKTEREGPCETLILNASERLSLSLHNFPHVDKKHFLVFW